MWDWGVGCRVWSVGCGACGAVLSALLWLRRSQGTYALAGLYICAEGLGSSLECSLSFRVLDSFITSYRNWKMVLLGLRA